MGWSIAAYLRRENGRERPRPMGNGSRGLRREMEAGVLERADFFLSPPSQAWWLTPLVSVQEDEAGRWQ